MVASHHFCIIWKAHCSTLCFAHGIFGGCLLGMFNWNFDCLSILMSRNAFTSSSLFYFRQFWQFDFTEPASSLFDSFSNLILRNRQAHCSTLSLPPPLSPAHPPPSSLCISRARALSLSLPPSLFLSLSLSLERERETEREREREKERERKRERESQRQRKGERGRERKTG